MENYIQANTAANAKEKIQIAYLDMGQGKPVILIHGWPLSKEMWEYQVESLVDAGYRVIAYDRRGFGCSSKPWDTSNYNYDTLADDLKALIDQLNLTDVTLVGFSMGGGEVVRYFSRHNGKNVNNVILISSIAPLMLKTSDNPEGVPQSMFDEMKEKIRKDRVGFLDDFGKKFFGVGLLKKPISAPLLEYYRMLASQASPKATLDCLDAFATTDFRKEMATIKVPTLIIHGSKDETVPIEPTSERAVKMIQNAKLEIYEDAPHGLFYTEMERLSSDMIAFLQQPTAAPQSASAPSL